MTAPTVTPEPLNCPNWCDREHGVEREFGDVWVAHTGTIAEPVEGTDRCAVVWIDALNDSAPSLVIALDREDANGHVARMEGLPPSGLEPAQAHALTRALQKATGAVTETAR